MEDNTSYPSLTRFFSECVDFRFTGRDIFLCNFELLSSQFFLSNFLFFGCSDYKKNLTAVQIPIHVKKAEISIIGDTGNITISFIDGATYELEGNVKTDVSGGFVIEKMDGQSPFSYNCVKVPNNGLMSCWKEIGEFPFADPGPMFFK